MTFGYQQIKYKELLGYLADNCSPNTRKMRFASSRRMKV